MVEPEKPTPTILEEQEREYWNRVVSGDIFLTQEELDKLLKPQDGQDQ